MKLVRNIPKLDHVLKLTKNGVRLASATKRRPIFSWTNLKTNTSQPKILLRPEIASGNLTQREHQIASRQQLKYTLISAGRNIKIFHLKIFQYLGSSTWEIFFKSRDYNTSVVIFQLFRFYLGFFSFVYFYPVGFLQFLEFCPGNWGFLQFLEFLSRAMGFFFNL